MFEWQNTKEEVAIVYIYIKRQVVILGPEKEEGMQR